MDDQYEWLEITTLSGHTTLIRGVCLHRDTADVYNLTGGVVARLCLTCDQQLPG